MCSMKSGSEKFLKRRKFLLVLPALVIPFVTLSVWALGLGSLDMQGPEQKQGLNTELPEAKIANEATDKLSLYNEAEKDSLDKKHASGLDPFAASDSLLPGYGQNDTLTQPGYGPILTSPGSYGSYGAYTDPNEAKVRERLAGLERALSEPTAPEQYQSDTDTKAGSTPPDSDMQKLEQMMASLSSGEGQDGEVTQLNELMEKVLDVQYPQRAQQKLIEASRKNKGRVYTALPKRNYARAEVMAMPRITDRARLVDSGLVPVYEPLPDENGFYGLAQPASFDTEQTAIPAVIHETQTLLSGATVKLRLTEDIMVNGMQVPAGTFVYGNCSINGERLQVEIPGIRYGKHLLPVALSVYDLDGLSGIRVPGAIGRDAAKNGAGQMVSGMQLMTLDPSLAAQAAGAGVEVAKGLFSKKAQLIRVTVKAGYPVLLMDEKARQDSN